MSKVTDRKIKHLKSKSIWPSIGFFLVLTALGGLMVAFAIGALLGYFVESGYITSSAISYEIVNEIKDNLEQEQDYSKALEKIQKQSNSPISISIMDENQKILASYGEKFTDDAICIPENETLDIQLSWDAESIKKEKQSVYINMQNLTRNIRNIPQKELSKMENSEGAGAFISTKHVLGHEVYSLDYWIQSNLDDNTCVCVQFVQKIYFNDCLVVMITAAVLGIVLVVLLFGYLISAITNIHSQRYLLKMLLRDPVTNGNNYTAFENYAMKAIPSIFNQKNGYAIVDFTYQKYQNFCTLHGTEEGELMLTYLDKCIKSFLQKKEIHARVAGADFIILFKIKEMENAENEIIRRVQLMMDTIPAMLAEYGNKRRIPQRVSNIKLKAGLYYLPAATTEETKERRKKKNLNIDQLYIKAGIAKNSLDEEAGLVVYNHEMWEKELWEQKVETLMHSALENEEFQVYIQPKYHPSTEELVGGEALVRWISPSEGFISPGQFIPIFEKTGFVTKLDDYMISHTAKLQAQWLEQGKKIVPISVNVSRIHFSQPDLAEHIKGLVDQYPLPHEYIEIELTESAFFDDKKALLTTVRKLQEYGFAVSMDDFGSGYSSLNSLKDLPLNVLKLDAEFFRGDVFDERGEIVVSKAISLAKQLNMRIVAEGVEKKEQVDFLAKQDCDMIQGYYFAKPMPANEYEERMKS